MNPEKELEEWLFIKTLGENIDILLNVTITLGRGSQLFHQNLIKYLAKEKLRLLSPIPLLVFIAAECDLRIILKF